MLKFRNPPRADDEHGRSRRRQPTSNLPRNRRPIEHRFIEIVPTRIVTLNQVDLPLARPALDRSLALDGVSHLVVDFVPDQALEAVAAGEAANPFAMLDDAAAELAGDAGVERAAIVVGHHVDGDPGVGGDHDNHTVPVKL